MADTKEQAVKQAQAAANTSQLTMGVHRVHYCGGTEWHFATVQYCCDHSFHVHQWVEPEQRLTMECELRLDGQRSAVHCVTAFCQEELESSVCRLLYELLNDSKDYSTFSFICKR